MRRFILLVLCGIVAGMASPTVAQPPGGMFGPRGDDRGERRWGEGRRGGDDHGSGDGRSRRGDRIEFLIRRLDANGDGVIQPNEVDESRRGFYERITTNLGLDPKGPIQVTALREAMQRRMANPQAGARPGGEATKDGAKPSDQSANKSSVPGFGIEAKPAGVTGFGPASTSQPGPSPGSSSSTSPSAGTPAGGSSGASPSSSTGTQNSAMDARIRQYAEALMRQYDKNKNGQLEKDEWSEMRGGLRNADRNGDGIITLDELTARLMEYSQNGGHSHDHSSSGSSTSSPSAGSSGSAAGGSGGVFIGGNGRKSYRFLSATERLPTKDLPSWFISQDANGDGQVTMAEYTSSWSDAKAREFAEWDLNGDGIVTAAEVLRKQKEKK